MRIFRSGLAAALCLGLAGTSVSAAEPANDTQRTLYALGVAMSQSLGDFALSAAEVEFVKTGLADGVLKSPLKVDMQVYGPKIQPLAEARAESISKKERAAGVAFLAKAAAESGVKKTASGAIVKVLKEGTGRAPTAADTVKVHYHGTLIDGTVFDSSIKRGEPATFPLGGVIKCWTEGVQQMKVGGRSRLVCPADLAYGDRGSPPAIKPGATLIFDVELLDIIK